jgi:hypothetical protein
MTNKAIGDALADAWLRSIPPFDKSLVDTGERYAGHPVFNVDFRTPEQSMTVRVYRHTLINSNHSVLAFVPTGASQ